MHFVARNLMFLATLLLLRFYSVALFGLNLDYIEDYIEDYIRRVESS